MTPRAPNSPQSYIGEAVRRATGVPRGVITKDGDGRATYICGVCAGSERFSFEATTSPKRWGYTDDFGWAHTGCLRRARRAAKAGHVQLGLGF
ncbi:hypothetical protein LCGC14_1789330 [marine sediment metagenome]|uniref:Uncharacterized protein n=1 Tax=marine sediment metagenome TaxID=412755 RepID=A0A0F9J7X2_9ZZZZ